VEVTGRNWKPSSKGLSATFPPQDVIAAVPGQLAERRDPPDLERAETVEKGHGRIETVNRPAPDTSIGAEK